MNYLSRMFAYAALWTAAAFGGLGCGDSGSGGDYSQTIGQDEPAAIEHIIGILENESYTCLQNVGVSLEDPRDGTYFPENYDLQATGPGNHVILVEHDSDIDPLIPTSIDAIAAREAEKKLPRAVVFGPDDTMQDVENRIYDIIDGY